MLSSKSAPRQSGFTLVELLIVAIILAILAAIIVPQFASTTSDAQESALRANVTAMRSAINLYRQQHGEYPSVNTAVGGVGCTGTAGTGSGGNEITLQDQLTLYSDAAGATCSVAGTLFRFGPYIQEDTLPTNPITAVGTVVIVSAGDLNVAADGSGLGWKFDNIAGKFIVNDTDLDSQGVAYSTY